MIWLGLIFMGLAMGSFCNVVIHRLPLEMSVVNPPRSACPKCGVPISAIHNIPIASWILLRGGARCCGESISFWYPAVEALVPLLWIVIYLSVGSTALLPVLLLFAAGATCVAVIDIRTRRIPHPLSSALAVVAITGTVVVAVAPKTASPNSGVLPSILVPLTCGLLAIMLVGSMIAIYPPSMGGGDMRLAFSVACVAAVGAGWQGSVVAVFSAFLTGGVLGCVLLVAALARGYRGKALRSIAMPFGPHLAVGGLVGAIWGQHLWRACLSLAVWSTTT